MGLLEPGTHLWVIGLQSVISLTPLENKIWYYTSVIIMANVVYIASYSQIIVSTQLLYTNIIMILHFGVVHSPQNEARMTVMWREHE